MRRRGPSALINSEGLVPDKIKSVERGLMRWAKKVRQSSRMTMDRLKHLLEELNSISSYNEILEELIIMKIQLNLEIDKGRGIGSNKQGLIG